ncbi:hypothetical protein [Streptomyces sp900116325]|uniref:hypothetical protein n=1 Tax=Streptomyces sp. 900116325 TaxID=3154295 RepID=UPI0033E664FD
MTSQPTPAVAVATDPAQSTWCSHCKADTRFTIGVFVLSSTGVTRVNGLSFCDVCDDPDSPLPVRRIDRG